MTEAETHWGISSHGERVKHEGPKDTCALPDCPKGTAVSPEGRVRLFLAITDYPNLCRVEYDERFETEGRPSKGYSLQRSDLEAVLTSLSMAREIRDANADRLDEKAGEVRRALDVLLNMANQLRAAEKEIERLKKEVDEYEEDVVGTLNEKNIALVRENGRLKETLKVFERDGKHWFAYGYQKDHGKPDGLQNFLDHCKICDQVKDHPAHF